MLPQGTCNSRDVKRKYDQIFPNALNAGKFDIDDCPAPEAKKRVKVTAEIISS